MRRARPGLQDTLIGSLPAWRWQAGIPPGHPCMPYLLLEVMVEGELRGQRLRLLSPAAR
jgi:hypothetical protein